MSHNNNRWLLKKERKSSEEKGMTFSGAIVMVSI